MSDDELAIDALLSATLRGEQKCGSWPATERDDWSAIVARIIYHGVAGLLWNKPGGMTGWPVAISKRTREEAVALAMWELRHRHLLNELLTALAAAKIVAILLKGTALAYGLYPTPATRARGDTDLLIDPADLKESRRIFERLGFKRAGHSGGDSGLFTLQEVWTLRCNDGMRHDVDLHWQTLNSPALEGVLPLAECAANCIALPRLGPNALALDRVRTLIHTCIHRTLSFTSPYFIGNRTYYGGDRLIWLNDIDLLARALSDCEWDTFVRFAHSKGVAAACLGGLLTTQRVFSTPVPIAVRDSLRDASTASRPAAYLRARQLGRAWQDLRAMPGVRQRYGYFLERVLPSAKFVRDKYPHHAGLPVAILYARRLFDLFRPRRSESLEQ